MKRGCVALFHQATPTLQRVSRDMKGIQKEEAKKPASKARKHGSTTTRDLRLRGYFECTSGQASTITRKASRKTLRTQSNTCLPCAVHSICARTQLRLRVVSLLCENVCAQCVRVLGSAQKNIPTVALSKSTLPHLQQVRRYSGNYFLRGSTPCLLAKVESPRIP